ncbi:hypothetical protein, partial [Silanimonas sp.]|uniref:beta strand repeat-containing protein n=1 Tax=Silanimonas sp. TaxID=1929290 RepID=UPI0022BCA098
ASFTAGAATLDLSTNGTTNAFGGAVTLTNSGTADVLINASGGLTLGAVSTGGNLTASVLGGTLTMNVANTFASGRNVSLSSTGATTAGITITANQTLAGGAFAATSDRYFTISSATLNSGGGDITIGANVAGTNGSGDFSGIMVNSSTIESRGGNIDLHGKGSVSGTTSTLQHGVHLYFGIVRSYTGAGDGLAGTITLTGTGGTYAGGDNGGVTIVGPTSLVQSRDGDITINATGGAGASGGNSGLYVGGGTIRTDGAGSITATASGGPGNASRGIVVTGNGNSFGRIETTGSGDIDLTGTGGTTNGNNVGVYVFNTVGSGTNHGVIRATGTGNVSVVGFGGTAVAASNVGIAVQDANSTISSNSGTLTLDGTATSSGTDPHGVYVALGGAVTSTSGAISILGDSTSGYGFATGGSSWTIGGGTTTGNISIVADTVNFTTTGATLQTSGTVTIAPGTGGTAIGIGGGAGAFQLPSALFAQIDAGVLVVGNVNAGMMTVGAGGVAYTNGNLDLRADSLVLDGDVNVGLTGTLTLHAKNGGVGQGVGSTVTAESLILRGGGNFALDRGGAGYNTVDHVAADVSVGGGSGLILLRTQSAGGVAEANIEIDSLGTVSGITTPGNLTWYTPGQIRQAGGAALDVTGTTTLDAGGAIDLTSAANIFGGAVTSTSGGGGSIQYSAASLTLGTTNAAGNLIVTTTGGGIN